MSDYVPTTWVNGGAPGISAENLNKMENGIDMAHQEIDAGWSPGDIKTTARSTPPVGWLECNGAAVSRTTYAALFAAIGTTFGAGDGSTTFNLPDLRGEFIRGWDHGRGVDSGRAFGSAQSDDFKSHNHTGATGNDTPDHVHGVPMAASGSGWAIIQNSPYATDFNLRDTGGAKTRHAHSIAAQGGTETRPRNVALMYCIKY